MSVTGGMVGREYMWRGERWRVLARWRAPTADEPYTFACPACGDVARGDWTIWAMLDEILGEDSYCGACGEMWREGHPAGHVAVDGWKPGGRPVVRNVLIESATTGQRVVRPFRGLRKVAAT